ncbi:MULTISPECIES: CsgE family curli-type amyloid fiber assembly protein [unclassified Myroides]|uniref:CsgE family curli-type amyloid fiber assembly protein n=1 Tax=unclassified Myroides TaxID=2642485 RepID=UPI003D2F7E19
MNTQIEAILDVKQDADQLHITSIAQSKTEITTSISYKLSLIKTNLLTLNQSKNDQSGRQVLEPFQRLALSSTQVNTTEEDRLIILLLIYDVNEKLIGTARHVINETRDENHIKESLTQQIEEEVEKVAQQEEVPYGQISFRGIVVDETKTKAGRDFYQLYYSNYLASNINSEHIITITEAITLGNNTKITLKTNQALIFEFFVRTQYDYLKTMSNTALTLTLRHLEQLKLNNQRTKTF